MQSVHGGGGGAPMPHPMHQQMDFHHQMQPLPSVMMPGQMMQALPHHTITSSMNRSQRCGVCRGCQCKPCGACTYCQDSPQFGGPGVKKQSCIERRCLRVLENRLQRDAPTFKARVGCNACEDCRMADCQICLVCLDKRFFDNRYMTGAMCAKKRCNNATSIELPAVAPMQHDMHMHMQIQQQQHRQAQKRAYEQMSPHHPMSPMEMQMKRRAEMVAAGYPMQMQQQQQLPPQGMIHPMHMQQRLIVPQMAPAPQPHFDLPADQNGNSQPVQIQHVQNNGNGSLHEHPVSSPEEELEQLEPIQQQQQQQLAPPLHAPPPAAAAPCDGYLMQQPQVIPNYAQPAPFDFYSPKGYFVDEISAEGDPFLPPSYMPEMKNAVVLQPL